MRNQIDNTDGIDRARTDRIDHLELIVVAIAILCIAPAVICAYCCLIMS
jgi:hypothetical protein